MALEHLSLQTFKEKIFDFEKHKEWKFEGDTNVLIDFYADWCAPCKAVAPVLEELATEYEGKVKIYKVNTEQEQQLAGMFGIRSIPSLLFIPVDGEPTMAQGAMGKGGFEEAFKTVFKI